MKPIALALSLALAAACGTGGRAPLASPTTAVAAPAVERLVVEGTASTVVMDPATGRILTTLPAGQLAPSRDLLVGLTAEGAATKLWGTDLAGRQVLDLTLSGRYAFPAAYGASPSGFSPNGKWLVAVARDDKESRFAIVDVARGAVAETITLGSRFSFDAIHNDGSALYLIEHPVKGSTAYNVRLYDVGAKRLQPEIIFDKTAIGQFDPAIGLMDGTFHVSVAPTTGDWSYGLYMRPNGSPFVHALNVPGRYAQCIVDLAGKWTPSSMFSMALSRDGRSLYVVDTAGGAISVIDAQRQKVARRATFATRGSGDPRAASAAVSPDGTRLYASGASGIATIQTSDLTLRGWAATDLAVRSVAVSTDGARLFALAADGIHVIDAASGRVQALLGTVQDAVRIRLVTRDPLSRS